MMWASLKWVDVKQGLTNDNLGQTEVRRDGKAVLSYMFEKKTYKNTNNGVCISSFHLTVLSFLAVTHKQMEAHTNLVHLSIGAISDHFHQFENPGWILYYKARKTNIY